MTETDTIQALLQGLLQCMFCPLPRHGLQLQQPLQRPPRRQHLPHGLRRNFLLLRPPTPAQLVGTLALSASAAAAARLAENAPQGHHVLAMSPRAPKPQRLQFDPRAKLSSPQLHLMKAFAPVVFTCAAHTTRPGVAELVVTARLLAAVFCLRLPPLSSRRTASQSWLRLGLAWQPQHQRAGRVQTAGTAARRTRAGTVVPKDLLAANNAQRLRRVFLAWKQRLRRVQLLSFLSGPCGAWPLLLLRLALL